ncbi:adenylyl-sulfate kinase, partial [Hydrogenophaga sp. OTU3427]|uniref:adenylyl-sulfate kinase n=1 Tax=Hydrogenophaga sp. OTU3427 TaxID=3043856 RepID=UPI00313ED22C
LGGVLLFSAGLFSNPPPGALAQDSKKHGTQGEALDFALLVDGLVAEREQGITIDVAYRFFATQRRKFIIADTPGHEQYTRNMVTGASTADLAIVLVNAQHGLLPQTRRHAFIAHLMGIRQVVLAINKMDMVGFDHARFHRISEDFEHFARDLNFSQITPIPLSALKGDNITERSGQMPWYRGPTLLGWLETVAIERQATAPFALPIQSVSRPTSDFRGFMGSVASGQVQPGDTVRVTRSGQTAQVRRLVTADGDLDTARQGDAITVTLDKEIDASRGDVLSLAQAPLQTSDQFEATLVWMHEDHGMVGRTYDLKLATQWAGATVTAIKHRVDIHHQLAHEAARQMDLNDMCVCNLALSKPIAFRPYGESQALGGFILVDRFTHATVAAGMLHHSLRRADNIHRQALSITREDRERLNGHPGKVIWFTGLSGSGKSTVANALEQALHQQGLRTYILDGDNVRHGLNRDLGFTDADRVENIRRVAEVARLMADAGLIVLTAFISPFRQERRMARELIGPSRFVEVFMDTPLAVCEQRDPKGLYQKARHGQLPNFTGIDSAYEPPEAADVTVPANADLSSTIQRLQTYCA